MKKHLKLACFAVVAAIAVTALCPKPRAWASALGTWLYPNFLMGSSQTMTLTGTAVNMTGTESHTGTVTISGTFRPPYPAVETIGAGGTITATNACGGLKRITSTAARTTDTTNTFTDPTTVTAPCTFDLVNIGSYTITLDNNDLFQSASGSNVALGSSDTIRVGLASAFTSDGLSRWVQIGATGNN